MLSACVFDPSESVAGYLKKNYKKMFLEKQDYPKLFLIS